MSDNGYIEREVLKAHYSWLPKDATLTPKEFDDIIDAQPAADVEPVVRCRQCRYSGSSENGYEECLITDSIHQPDFYCALGKKCGA